MGSAEQPYAGAVELEAVKSVLRPFRSEDRDDLVANANDRRVWLNLSDRFPYPYTVQDADQWIARCVQEGEPTRNFAIEVERRVVGGIGLELLPGEKQHVANVGYWIGHDWWNRGIATDALRVFVAYAFDTFPMERLQATVFGWNPASARVLEKCGFQREGCLHGAITKAGETTDELWYGLLRPRV